MEKDIVAYKTVGSSNQAQFDRDVNQAMKEGWILYGTPFSCGNEVVQAVVKFKNTFVDHDKQ